MIAFPSKVILSLLFISINQYITKAEDYDSFGSDASLVYDDNSVVGDDGMMMDKINMIKYEEKAKMAAVKEELKIKMDALKKEEDIEMKEIPSSTRSGFIPTKFVRFNKFDVNQNFEKTSLTPDSYPISANEATVTFLKEGTNAESVVNHLTDNEIIYNVEELINIAGGPPDHPSDNFRSPYWDKLNKVLEMRKIRGNKRAAPRLSAELQLPLRWKNFTIDGVAEAVYDEYPGLHQAEFIEDLVSGKYGEVEYNTDIIPRRSNSQFLREIIMLADINTWSIRVVGPHNFGAKWFAGRARPEEVAWMIREGMINAPNRIRRKILAIEDFNKATDFTRYDREGREGSPRHPSWPAMHSAGSNMSFWIQVVMNLTPRQLCEAKKVDFAVSFARTVAGVHFEDDNMAGLNMGQEIVARALPGHLAETYDSDIDAVIALSNEKRFKWEDYKPLEDCNYL